MKLIYQLLVDLVESIVELSGMVKVIQLFHARCGKIYNSVTVLVFRYSLNRKDLFVGVTLYLFIFSLPHASISYFIVNLSSFAQPRFQTTLRTCTFGSIRFHVR